MKTVMELLRGPFWLVSGQSIRYEGKRYKDSEEFFVVENLRVYKDMNLGLIYNVHSRISDFNFNFILEDFAKKNEMEVYFSYAGTVILKGEASAFEALKKENGDLFSYAVCDMNQVDLVLQRLAEYCLETEEDYHDRRLSNVVHLDAYLQ